MYLLSENIKIIIFLMKPYFFFLLKTKEIICILVLHGQVFVSAMLVIFVHVFVDASLMAASLKNSVLSFSSHEKIHECNDQEKAQSERNPHSKNRGGKN